MKMRLYTVLTLVAVAHGGKFQPCVCVQAPCNCSPDFPGPPDLPSDTRYDERCPSLTSSGVGQFNGGIISTCDVDMKCSGSSDAGSFNPHLITISTSTTTQCEREGGYCCPKACGGLGCHMPEPTCSKRCDMDPCCGCDNGLEYMSACAAPPMCMTEDGVAYEAESITGLCCVYKDCPPTRPKTPYCGKMGNPEYDFKSGEECVCGSGEDKVMGYFGNRAYYCMEELICKSPKVKVGSTGCGARCSEIYEPRNYGCDPIPEPACACPSGTYIGDVGGVSGCLTRDECPKPDGWCETNADCATGEKCEQGGFDSTSFRGGEPRMYKTCVAGPKAAYCGKEGRPEYDVKSGEECVCETGEEKAGGWGSTPWYCAEKLVCKSPKVNVSYSGCEPRCSEIYEPRMYGCDPYPGPACACPSGTYIGDVAGVSGCLTHDECPKPDGWCETNSDCATGEKCEQGAFDPTSSGHFGAPNYKTCVADPDSGPSCEDSKYFGKSKVAKTCKKVAKKVKKAKKKLSKGKKLIKKNPDSKKAQKVDLDKLQNAVDTANSNKDHCDWFLKNC